MKKPVIIGLIVVVLVVIGGFIWMATQNNASKTSTTVAPAVVTTDMTDKTEVEVVMHDLSFNPASITIKKGTKVTWVNQDTVAHNVVATDPNNTGGLPTTAPTFGRGGTASTTFTTVGTFEYLCTPHKQFMHGTVHVVD